LEEDVVVDAADVVAVDVVVVVVAAVDAIAGAVAHDIYFFHPN